LRAQLTKGEIRKNVKGNGPGPFQVTVRKKSPVGTEKIGADC